MKVYRVHRTQIIGILLIVMVLVLGACSPKTVTLPPETVTTTLSPETVTVTLPPETVAVTLPPETVAVTLPPETVTVTLPPETVTTTLPTPTPTTFDLAIKQTVNNPRPIEKENIIYTITLTNLSSIAASGVEVTDQLPADVTFISYQATLGTYDSNTGVWTVGNLAESTDVSLFVTARPDMGTYMRRFTNCATLTAVDQTDTNSANDNACANIIVAGTAGME